MSLRLSGLVLAVGLTRVGCASTLDFENLPSGIALTDQYTGLTFSHAVVLTAGISLNEFNFPPASGTNVVSDDGAAISVSFSTPIRSFSGFFTYSVPILLEGFDSTEHLLVSTPSHFDNNLACLGGPPCLANAGSSPDESLSITYPGDIWTVIIKGAPGGSSYTGDNFAFETAIPEPALWKLLTAGALILFGTRILQRLFGGLEWK